MTDDPFGPAHRAAGGTMVAVAAMEQTLQWALEMSMPGLTKPLAKRLFTGLGPLSHFSSKIDLAVAMALIDRDLARDLHTLRKIRNEFAHSTTELHHDDEPVATLLQKLPLKRRRTDSSTAFFLRNALNCRLRLQSIFAIAEEGEGVIPPSLT